MNASPEDEPRLLTRELLREAGAGMIEDEAIDELLADTWWEHECRRTSVGTAHVFTRPVTLLESLRVDSEKYHNHRHTLGVTRPNGERFLTYVVLWNVHTQDVSELPQIESDLAGRGRIRRQDFLDHELRVMDRAWMKFEDIGRELNLSPRAAKSFSDRARGKFGFETRDMLAVTGLREGFFNPPLEQWQGRLPEMPPYLARYFPYAHLTAPKIAERIGTTARTAYARICDLYEATGARTRIELVLIGLANGVMRLDDLEVDVPGPKLAEYEKSIIALIDLPVNEIARRRGISPNTVSSGIVDICGKLGLNSRAEVALFGFREGYLQIPTEIDESLADVFTPRQLDIAPYLGYANQEIAEKTGLTLGAVEHLAVQARDAAGAKNRIELVLYLARAGLINPDDYLSTRRA